MSEKNKEKPCHAFAPAALYPEEMAQKGIMTDTIYEPATFQSKEKPVRFERLIYFASALTNFDLTFLSQYFQIRSNKEKIRLFRPYIQLKWSF